MNLRALWDTCMYVHTKYAISLMVLCERSKCQSCREENVE